MKINALLNLEYYTFKTLVKIVISGVFLSILIGILTSPEQVMLVSLTFVVFMLNITFSITEKSNFTHLYSVLPIKDNLIILSKYIFSLIALFLTASFSFITYLVLHIILNNTLYLTGGIRFLALSLTLCILFISLQYPIYFRWGYSKASLVAILPYIIFFTLGFPFYNYLMSITFFNTLISDLVLHSQNNSYLLVLASVLISFTMLVISYWMSVRLLSKDR